MRENRQNSEEIVEIVLSADNGDDEEDDDADKEEGGEQHTNDPEEDEKGEPISTAPALWNWRNSKSEAIYYVCASALLRQQRPMVHEVRSV